MLTLIFISDGSPSHCKIERTFIAEKNEYDISTTIRSLKAKNNLAEINEWKEALSISSEDYG